MSYLQSIQKFPTFCVVSLGPVIASSTLAEAEVIWPENPPVGPGSYRVHCSRLQVHQHRPGNVLSTRGLIVVDLDSLQLEVRVPVVLAVRVDAMLIRDNLPELGSDLPERNIGTNKKEK